MVWEGVTHLVSWELEEEPGYWSENYVFLLCFKADNQIPVNLSK